MKEVIILRHAEKRGDELTPQGKTACIALAQKVGTFSAAIASDRNRAIQTAWLISGKPVHTDVRASVPQFPADELKKLANVQANHPLGIIGAIWGNPSLISNARDAGLKLLELVKETLLSLADGERALIVSHDGTMIALEKLLRDESFETVNHSFGPLQGLRVDEQLATRKIH